MYLSVSLSRPEPPPSPLIVPSCFPADSTSSLTSRDETTAATRGAALSIIPSTRAHARSGVGRARAIHGLVPRASKLNRGGGQALYRSRVQATAINLYLRCALPWRCERCRPLKRKRRVD